MTNDITLALENSEFSKALFLNGESFIGVYEKNVFSPSGYCCSGVFPATRSNLSELETCDPIAYQITKEQLNSIKK